MMGLFDPKRLRPVFVGPRVISWVRARGNGFLLVAAVLVVVVTVVRYGSLGGIKGRIRKWSPHSDSVGQSCNRLGEGRCPELLS